jgi:hypothetical protein
MKIDERGHALPEHDHGALVPGSVVHLLNGYVYMYESPEIFHLFEHGVDYNVVECSVGFVVSVLEDKMMERRVGHPAAFLLVEGRLGWVVMWPDVYEVV